METVNKYADKVSGKKKNTTAPFSQATELLNALAYVKTKAAKGGKPVPADENGLEALVDAKYRL